MGKEIGEYPANLIPHLLNNVMLNSLLIDKVILIHKTNDNYYYRQLSTKYGEQYRNKPLYYINCSAVASGSKSRKMVSHMCG